MKTEEIDGSDNLQLVKFPTMGLFNYWADISNDENLQNMKFDDNFDDDIDVTDWKEPVKTPPSSTREEEGI